MRSSSYPPPRSSAMGARPHSATVHSAAGRVRSPAKPARPSPDGRAAPARLSQSEESRSPPLVYSAWAGPPGSPGTPRPDAAAHRRHPRGGAAVPGTREPEARDPIVGDPTPPTEFPGSCCSWSIARTGSPAPSWPWVKLRIGDHVREELSVEIAAMMTGEQLEIGHELRQGTVTSARGSGAVERSERDPYGVHKWPDLPRLLRRVRRVDRTARRRARAGARLPTRPPAPWRASSPCRKGRRRRRA